MACFKTSTVVHPSEQPNGSAQEDGRDAPQRAVSEMPLLLLLNDPKAKTRFEKAWERRAGCGYHGHQILLAQVSSMQSK
jgi:hypothetical protein